MLVASKKMSQDSYDSQPADLELVEATRKGDQAAFGQLVRRHEGIVAATVIGMLGHSPEADDIGQETFVRFYRAINSFRGDAKLSTYLTRIAINLSLNELKRRKRRLSIFSRPEPEIVEQMPAQPQGDLDYEDKATIRKAIGKLKPEHRAVVVLRLVDGYSTRETADILKVPLGTILSRLARAQEKLRDILKPQFGDR